MAEPAHVWLAPSSSSHCDTHGKVAELGRAMVSHAHLRVSGAAATHEVTHAATQTHGAAYLGRVMVTSYVEPLLGR